MNELFFVSDTHWDHYNIVLHCNRDRWIYPNPDYDSDKPFHFNKNNPKAVDLEAHNEALIEYWNKRVGKKDKVIHHGDFAHKNHKKWISALNGKKVLIKGNHDKMNHDSYHLFKEFDVNEDSFFNDISKENKSILKKFKNGEIDLTSCNKEVIKILWSRFVQIERPEDIDQMNNECYNMFEGVYEMGFRRKINGKDITMCHYALRTWANSFHGSYNTYGHSHGRMPEYPNMLSFDVGVDIWGYAPIPWDAIECKMKKKMANKKCADGESQLISPYSDDPEERVKQIRVENLAILEEIGAEIF